MKNLIYSSIFFVCVLSSCKKDVSIVPIEIKTNSTYDVFYVNGRLDSIVIQQGLSTTTRTVEHHDNYFDVTKSFASSTINYTETKRYMVENDYVTQVLIKRDTDTSFHLHQTYSYHNGQLDSLHTYRTTNQGVVLTKSTKYWINPSDQCRYLDNKYFSSDSSTISTTNKTCYGEDFPYYLPTNVFQFSKSPLATKVLTSVHEDKKINGVTTSLFSTSYLYDFNETISKLKIKHYTELNDLLNNEVTNDSSQITITYHGI